MDNKMQHLLVYYQCLSFLSDPLYHRAIQQTEQLQSREVRAELNSGNSVWLKLSFDRSVVGEICCCCGGEH